MKLHSKCVVFVGQFETLYDRCDCWCLSACWGRLQPPVTLQRMVRCPYVSLCVFYQLKETVRRGPGSAEGIWNQVIFLMFHNPLLSGARNYYFLSEKSQRTNTDFKLGLAFQITVDLINLSPPRRGFRCHKNIQCTQMQTHKWHMYVMYFKLH